MAFYFALVCCTRAVLALPFCGDRKEAKSIRGPVQLGPLRSPYGKQGTAQPQTAVSISCLPNGKGVKPLLKPLAQGFSRGYTKGVPPAVKESPRTLPTGASAVLFPISVRTEIGRPCGRSTSSLSKVQNYNPALAELKLRKSTLRQQRKTFLIITSFYAKKQTAFAVCFLIFSY